MNPDFRTFIESYDILIFQESKTDGLDVLELANDYMCFGKHRRNAKAKTAEIELVFKRYLLKSLTFISSESEFVQWVRVSKDIFTIDSDLFLGCIYISTENSKYSSLEAFNEIESELIQLSSGCDYFSLIGDFNAKTGDTQDYISKDEKLSTVFKRL